MRVLNVKPKERNWKPFKFLKELDMFGAPVPGLNMQGKTAHKTSLGTLISILIMMLTLLYALFKM